MEITKERVRELEARSVEQEEKKTGEKNRSHIPVG